MASMGCFSICNICLICKLISTMIMEKVNRSMSTGLIRKAHVKYKINFPQKCVQQHVVSVVFTIFQTKTHLVVQYTDPSVLKTQFFPCLFSGEILIIAKQYFFMTVMYTYAD